MRRALSACAITVLMVACGSTSPPPTAAPPTAAPATTSPTSTSVAPTDAPTAIPSAAPTLTPSPSAQPSASLADELIAPGTLSVCAALVGPPAASLTDAGEPVGFNIAFGREIAHRLDLDIDFQHPLFDEVSSYLSGHQCDVSISSQNITAAREALMSMTPYTRSQQPVLVGKGNPSSIRALDDLCGLAVSATSGTTHVELVNGTGDYAGQGLNAACVTAGNDPIDLHIYPSEQEAVQALLDNEVVAYLGNPNYVYDYPDLLDYAQTALPAAKQGIATALDHPLLTSAVAGALAAMIDDGTYEIILGSYLPNQESVQVVSIVE